MVIALSLTISKDINSTFVQSSSNLEFGSKLTRDLGDVGGQKTLRSYWRNYFEKTDALIWVVDATDRLRIEDCRAELHGLLVEEVCVSPLCFRSTHPNELIILETLWGKSLGPCEQDRCERLYGWGRDPGGSLMLMLLDWYKNNVHLGFGLTADRGRDCSWTKSGHINGTSFGAVPWQVWISEKDLLGL